MGHFQRDSFGELLRDGMFFAIDLRMFTSESNKSLNSSIATDGETYGHHKKFGEMALAYAMTSGVLRKGWR